DSVASVPVILEEERVLNLREANYWSTGDTGVGERRTALIGREVCEAIGTVEVAGQVVLLVEDLHLRAGLQDVALGGQDGVVVQLDVELALLLRADGSAATVEGSGDLDLRSGGDRRVGVAIPAQAEARLVHQVDVGCGDIAEAEHVLVLLLIVSR